MEEIIQAIKDLINEKYDEVDGGQDKIAEVNDWDLWEDDRLVRDAAYIWGLETALYKLIELRKDGEE